MLNLPFLFPFNFLFLSFSFLLIIFSNFLCYFLPQKTANSIKSHIYSMFHLLSFSFLSMFLFVSFRVSFFSFSFFSLVISDLRAFLFYPRVLYSLPALISLCHHRDAYYFRPVSVDLAALLPSSGIAPVQKFNAVKSASFAASGTVVVTCCNSRISPISSGVV